jgi:hypothetical protein
LNEFVDAFKYVIERTWAKPFIFLANLYSRKNKIIDEEIKNLKNLKVIIKALKGREVDIE